MAIMAKFPSISWQNPLRNISLSSYSLLGLDLTSHTVQAALVAVKGSKTCVKKFITWDLHTDEAAIHQIRKEFSKELFVTALDASATIVRPLKISLTKPKDVAAALPFQMEPLLPYSIDEAILDKIVLDKGEEVTQLMVIAAQKEQVASHLAKWENINIEPEIVTAAPAALAALSRYISDEPSLHFIISINEEETVCALVKEGNLLAAQTFDFGVNDFIEAYERDLAPHKNLPSLQQIDFSALDQSVHANLIESASLWQKQAMRTLLSIGKQSRGEVIKYGLLLGQGALFCHLGDDLFSALNLTPLPWNASGQEIGEETLKRYTMALAAALSKSPFFSAQLDFRQGDLAYPHRWQRIQKPLITYMGLTLLLAFTLFLCFKSLLHNRDEQIRSEYMTFLSATHKDYKDVEKEVAEKLAHGRKLPDFVPKPVEELSAEEISYRLSLINKELQGFPEIFPLYPAVPRVSDFLAWLATHPNVVLSTDEDKKATQDAIKIEQLTYTLVKRPQQSSPQEHYQVRIEMEFTSPTATQARAFHDALMAPNDMVDPKGEIRWNAGQNHYRTSFFLKDKTPYISAPR
jgi:type IV pilus assembly protein PilM